MQKQEYLEIVLEAFETLENIPEVKTIMSVISQLKRLKIIFIFTSKYIKEMNSSCNNTTEGLTIAKEGIIYIGARQLLESKSSESYRNALVTLAHEMNHLAYLVIFQNDCLPFYFNDEYNIKNLANGKQINQREEFLKMVESYKLKTGDSVIEEVYTYDKQKWPKELIVQAVEILVLHASDDEMLGKMTRKYADLFTYFTKTLNIFKNNLSMVAIRQEAQVINKTFEKSYQYFMTHNDTLGINSFNDEKIDEKLENIFDDCDQNYVSRFPLLTTLAIYHKLSAHFRLKVNSLYIFANCTQDFLQKEAIQTYSELVLQNYPSKLPILVFECSKLELKSSDYSKLESLIKTTRRTIFITNYDSNVNCSNQWFKCQKKIGDIRMNFLAAKPIDHSWEDFSLEKQNEFLKSKINFQSLDSTCEVSLNELLNVDAETMKFFPLECFINNKTCQVNSSFCDSLKLNKFYMPRTFVCENSSKLNVIDLLAKVESSKVIVIEDESGIGKSRSLKEIALKLKHKNPTIWVVFVELGKIHEVLEKELTSGKKTLVSFLVENILKLESEFELKLFQHLYNEKKVIIFLDGLDEIYPTYFKRVMFKIFQIVFSEIQLWIATRPNFSTVAEEKIFKNLNPTVVSLNRLSNAMNNSEQLNFIKEFFKMKDESLEFDENVNETISKNLQSFLSDELLKLLEFPLYLEWIVKIFGIKLLQSSPSSSDKISTLYDFCDKFVSETLKRWRQKIKFLSKPLTYSANMTYQKESIFSTWQFEKLLVTNTNCQTTICVRLKFTCH